MVYQKYLPSPELRNYIECYFVWHSSGQAVDNLIIESPPNGYCSIVFNCGSKYILRNKKYEKLEVPLQFIAGQSIYSYSLHLNGVIDICGIVLKPTAINAIFNVPAYEYTEERVPLASILGQSTVDETFNTLKSQSDPNERVKTLESFATHYYHQAGPTPDFIDTAVETIIEKRGMLDVGAMMENIFMSRRNFERKFFKKVGLSPKYYARIRRMAYLMNVIAGKKKADWGSLFSEVEFHDQSHFIKDFLEFTGRTPKQYLEDNHELANLVDKPTPSSIRY